MDDITSFSKEGMFQFTFNSIIYSKVTNKRSRMTKKQKDLCNTGYTCLFLYFLRLSPGLELHRVDIMDTVPCLSAVAPTERVPYGFWHTWRRVREAFSLFPIKEKRPHWMVLRLASTSGPGPVALHTESGSTWAARWALNKPFKYIRAKNCRFICALYNNLLSSSA